MSEQPHNTAVHLPQRVSRSVCAAPSARDTCQPFIPAHTPVSGTIPTTVFLVGVPRSGSTLLAYLLAGLPNSLSLSEPYLAQDIYPHWRLRRYFRRIERAVGMRHSRVPRPCTPATLLDHMQRITTANGLHCLIVKETYRCAREWKNDHLLDRLAARGHSLIVIHRHPYDIAVSSLKFCRWWRGVPGRMIRLIAPRMPLFSTDRAFIEHCADNWASLVGWCRRQRIKAIRYEDLVADPESSMRGVCASAGLPFTPAMLDYKHPRSGFGGIGAPEVLNRAPRPVNTQSVGRKHLLAPEWQEVIASKCAAGCRELDYTL